MDTRPSRIACWHCRAPLPDVSERIFGRGRQRRFCDDTCRHAYAEARSAEQREKQPRCCAHCGGPMTEVSFAGRPPKFCTDDCRRAAHEARENDLAPEQIEAIFQRAKAVIRHRRAMESAR